MTATYHSPSHQWQPLSTHNHTTPSSEPFVMSLPTAFPPPNASATSLSHKGTAYTPPKLRSFQERKREKELELLRSNGQVSRYDSPRHQPLQLSHTQPQTTSYHHTIPTHLLGQPFSNSTIPSKPTPPPRRRESVDFAILRGVEGTINNGRCAEEGRELRHQSSMSLGSMGSIRSVGSMGTIRETVNGDQGLSSLTSERKRPLPTPTRTPTPTLIGGQGGGISSIATTRQLPSPSPISSSTVLHNQPLRQSPDIISRYEGLERQPTNVLPYPYTMISTPTSQTSIATATPHSSHLVQNRSNTLPIISNQYQGKVEGGTGMGGGRRPLPKPLTNRHSVASFHVPSIHLPTQNLPSSFSSHQIPPTWSENGDDDGRRALPDPPIMVATTKSLDRGTVGVRVGEMSEVGNVTHSPSLDGVNKGVSEMTVSIPSISLPCVEASMEIEKPAIPTIVLPDEETSTIPIIVFPEDVGNEPEIAVEPPTRTPSPSFTLSSTPAIQVSTDEGPRIVIPSFNFSEVDSSCDIPIINLPVDPSSHRPSTHQGPGIFCASCDNAIIGRIVSAMSQRWHPECFKCETCKMLLEHVSSYEHEGMAYCHMDYHDQFAPKCHHCATAIVDSRFVTINDPTLGQRYYHELHFFCAECGDPFLEPSKSSAAGTEFLRSTDTSSSVDEEEDQTKEFVIHGKYAFCEECHVKLHKPKCKGCRKPIRDVAVGALGGKWHKECFTCTQCKEQIMSASFFPKDGKAFCQDCYTASL